MNRRLVGQIALFLALLIAAPPVASGQGMRAMLRDNDGTENSCHADGTAIDMPDLPGYTMRRLDSPEVLRLKAELRAAQWAHAVQTYTTVFQPGLPDWIVYIDRFGAVTQCVLAHRFADTHVRDERFIWVMVFSELKVASISDDSATTGARRAQRNADRDAKELVVARWDAAVTFLDEAAAQAVEANRSATSDSERATTRAVAMKAVADAADAHSKRAAAISTLTASRLDSLKAVDIDTVDLRFARRTVVRQADPVLIGLLKGFGKIVGYEPPASESASLPDSIKTVWLRPVAVDTSETMLAGFSRMALVPNSVVELSIAPPPGKEFVMPPSATLPQIERIHQYRRHEGAYVRAGDPGNISCRAEAACI